MQQNAYLCSTKATQKNILHKRIFIPPACESRWFLKQTLRNALRNHSQDCCVVFEDFFVFL
jgi:hypothetical protein